jgi:hypothetical protein
MDIIRSVNIALLIVLLAGCSIVPAPTRSPHIGGVGMSGGCADFFAALDKRASESQALDPGAFRVEGHPYLRTNRFLASFSSDAVADRAAFAAWVDRMQTLDQEARRHEIANLPAAAGPGNSEAELNARVAGCGNHLKAAEFQDAESRLALREKTRVPDEYLTLPRVLGLYPLTSLLVSNGVQNWHSVARESFSTDPPAGWRVIRYGPERSTGLPDKSPIVASAERDILGIPVYSPTDLEALFWMHAPVWEVRTEAEYDRIGAPVWTPEGVIDIDTGQPVTYTLLSFTRFGREILTQLNYIIWFPARPKEHALDIYGGLLDGVNYRVTLDRNGNPLLYETIHNCGCYYEAYPTGRLRVREKIDYAEPPLILKAPELTRSNDRVVVAMETRTHYVRHLYPISRGFHPEMATYSLSDYDALRSLPDPKGGRRSMFGPDSLAPGSERLERFILWPTGVVSPGAMRQWGRHAVAFVGERHFDDPDSMDKMFIESRFD